MPRAGLADTRTRRGGLRERRTEPGLSNLAERLVDGQRKRAGESVWQGVREPHHVRHPDADARPPGLVRPRSPRRLVQHDPAAIHEHDPVRPRCDLVDTVLDDQYAGTLILREPAQGAEHFLRTHRVQVGQRLVKHQDPRPHR